jgi:hypothetical protein
MWRGATSSACARHSSRQVGSVLSKQLQQQQQLLLLVPCSAKQLGRRKEQQQAAQQCVLEAALARAAIALGSGWLTDRRAAGQAAVRAVAAEGIAVMRQICSSPRCRRDEC